MSAEVLAKTARSKPEAMLFAPYLATLGGGERVMTAAATVLSARFAVQLCSPQEPDRDRWTQLGFPPLDVEQMNAREFMRRSIGVDVAVVMSNHVPLPSMARRPYLIVQFPVSPAVRGNGWQHWRNRAVLQRYRVLTYSGYNQTHIHDRWGVDSTVLAPPVTQYAYRPERKTNLILSVGRLSAGEGFKRHDALLDAWAVARHHLPGWEFVIAGAAQNEHASVAHLRQRAADVGASRIEADATAQRLTDLYERASIYWHGAGFGRLPDRPDLAEHFGMSTVEAMSAGAVPVVYRDGGQVEIVEGTGGVLWTTAQELVDETIGLARSVPSLRYAAERASDAAKDYSLDAFTGGLFAVMPSRP